MAGETEDPDLAAERLEAALERIADAAVRAQAAEAAMYAQATEAAMRAEAAEAAFHSQAAAQAAPAPIDGNTSADAPPPAAFSGTDPATLIAELDDVIARLRAALGTGRV